MIDILLATYNGERYLESQILSIIAQTHKQWRLIIHDDGSVDSTVDLINKYTLIDRRITFINDGRKFGSAGEHFLYMLDFAREDVICFCDQDDIWLEDKLSAMLEVLQNKHNGAIPQVIFSDAYLYYSDRHAIEGYLLVTRPHSLRELLFTNGGVHGSASMFNRAMKESLLRDYAFVAMHDHLLTLIGCSFGEVTYLEKKLFLYRQHASNATGNMDVRPLKRIMAAFRSISTKSTVIRSNVKGVESFGNTHIDKLSEADLKLIENFLSLEHRGIFGRFLNIVVNGYSLNGSKVQLWVKLLTRGYMQK